MEFGLHILQFRSTHEYFETVIYELQTPTVTTNMCLPHTWFRALVFGFPFFNLKKGKSFRKGPRRLSGMPLILVLEKEINCSILTAYAHVSDLDQYLYRKYTIIV